MELSVLALRLSWNRNVEAFSFSAVTNFNAFFIGNFIKVSLFEEIIEEKICSIKKNPYFCHGV